MTGLECGFAMNHTLSACTSMLVDLILVVIVDHATTKLHPSSIFHYTVFCNLNVGLNINFMGWGL